MNEIVPPWKLIWTFTMLSAFENCNYKALRQYLADVRLPYVEGPAQAKGNRAHSAFEKRIVSGHPLPDDMTQYEPVCQTLVSKRAVGEMKLGINTTGHPVQFYECGDGDGRCKIDTTIMAGERAMIIDWKTNGKPREDPYELEIQALMLKAKYPHLKVLIGHYYWLTPNKLGWQHDLSNTAHTWKRVQGTIENIRAKKAVNWFPKNENPLCPWCDVPKTDCEFRKDIPNGR